MPAQDRAWDRSALMISAGKRRWTTGPATISPGIVPIWRRNAPSLERSFAGWPRTGMAAVGIALGFAALCQALEPDRVPIAMASLFLVIAIFIFAYAERRARVIMNRLETHTVVTLKPVRTRLLTAALVVATFALTAATWCLA